MTFDDQFDPVYRLRYEAYRREEFIPINSQQVVRDYGGRLVRINPREAGVGSALDVGLACGALAGLAILERAREREPRLVLALPPRAGAMVGAERQELVLLEPEARLEEGQRL